VCSDGDSITWRLSVPHPSSNLPITRFRIQYMQYSQLRDFEDSLRGLTGIDEFQQQLWKNQGIVHVFDASWLHIYCYS
jgi:hypothetical protein